MVIATFRFTHCGFPGTLTVNDQELIVIIEENVKLGLRSDLYSILIFLLLGEHIQSRDYNNYTLIELAEVYRVFESSVSLSNGMKFCIV